MDKVRIRLRPGGVSLVLKQPRIGVQVGNGGIVHVYPPDYEGDYVITPTDEDIILPTSGRYMRGNITVEKIPDASKAIRKLCILDLWEYEALPERSNDTLYYVRG